MLGETSDHDDYVVLCSAWTSENEIFRDRFKQTGGGKEGRMRVREGGKREGRGCGRGEEGRKGVGEGGERVGEGERKGVGSN